MQYYPVVCSNLVRCGKWVCGVQYDCVVCSITLWCVIGCGSLCECVVFSITMCCIVRLCGGKFG